MPCRTGWRQSTALLYCLASLALASFLAPLCHAARTRNLNLEQMTSKADRIFAGRCQEVRLAIDPQLGQPVTYVTLVPQQAVKGTLRGRLTIRLLGNQTAEAGPAEATEGLPVFAEGEDVVLFLYGDSVAGLTSPVGFGQGKFKVVRDKNGASHVVNGFGNQGLLEGLSPKGQAKLGTKLEKFRGGKAIPVETFLAMIKDLAK